MSQTITLRLPDRTADWLKSSARRMGRSVNELGTALIEEARHISEFAEIEFRTFNGERHACVKGHLQVWQVIAVARDYGMNVEKAATHFGWPVWQAQAAFHYYEAFPSEIDEVIEANRAMDYDQLKRLFPQMKLVEVAMPQSGSPVYSPVII